MRRDLAQNEAQEQAARRALTAFEKIDAKRDARRPFLTEAKWALYGAGPRPSDLELAQARGTMRRLVSVPASGALAWPALGPERA